MVAKDRKIPRVAPRASKMDRSFTILPVTTADGPALAATCIPAFWTDPHWRLSWPHRTLKYHVSQVALRYPRNLLQKWNRATARHQKAVDDVTGEILGYARWSIPASHATLTAGTGSDKIAWSEAQVPSVPAEEEAEIVRVAESAIWDPDPTSDPLLNKPLKIKAELLARKPYMSMQSPSLQMPYARLTQAPPALDYLAVHPKHQRRGVATALVRSGMRQAAALGLDIFIHAMPAGVPVYTRLGFRIEREIEQDDTAYGGPGLYSDYFHVFEQPAGTRDGGEEAGLFATGAVDACP